LHWVYGGIDDIEEATIDYIKTFELKKDSKINDKKIKKYILQYYT